MNRPTPHRSSGMQRTRAITLVEALVVLVVIGIVAVIVLPGLRKAKAKTNRPSCFANLKQIGIACRLFATDHQGRLPFEVSTNEGGSRELGGGAWLHFRPASNELSSPRMLVCPTESKQRRESYASNFASLGPNRTVSYFLNPDAREAEPQSILSGDRHLSIDGFRPPSGVVHVNPNATLEWTRELHPPPGTNLPSGNLVFSDGRVEQLTSIRLSERFRDGKPKPSRLIMP